MLIQTCCAYVDTLCLLHTVHTAYVLRSGKKRSTHLYSVWVYVYVAFGVQLLSICMCVSNAVYMCVCEPPLPCFLTKLCVSNAVYLWVMAVCHFLAYHLTCICIPNARQCRNHLPSDGSALDGCACEMDTHGHHNNDMLPLWHLA